MKKLILTLIAAAGLITSSHAAQEVFAIQTGVSVMTNLINRGGTVYEVTIYNPTAVTTTYALYDAPNTNTTRGPLQGYFNTYYSNGAYTVYSSYLTNITRMYTNYYGVTNSITKSNVLVTVGSTQVAATNNYRLIAYGEITTGASATIPLEGPLNYTWGLTFTNRFSTNTTVTINYNSAL